MGLATMADIAASANASSRDVALVLAADPRVPPDIRSRVTDAIYAASYYPLAAIRARLGRPLRFAIVFKSYLGDDPEANRFYAPIASAIALSCAQDDTEIRQVSMTVDAGCELLEVPAALNEGVYDGAYVLGSKLGAAAVQALEGICPIVLVDGYSDRDAVDSVVCDNAGGAATAVEYLIAAGHREIAIIGSEPDCYPSILDRRTGYARALEAHGLAPHFVDASYVLTQAVGVIAVDYVRQHPAVTAVFGVNDLTSVAFMQVARNAGLRLPADMALVGFDDIDLASLVMPALTTLAVDKALMGRAAFALMTHRLEVTTAGPVTAVVVPRLIERESVAPPRRR